MSDLAPVLKQRFFDANGLPLAGGFLYSYAAGTTTPLTTYTDQSGLTPNANPVVLDSEGYANVWLGANSYKFVLYDANNNLQFTEDNVVSISAQIAAAGLAGFLSVVIPYTLVQTASTSNAIPLFTLPAGAILEEVAIKHSTKFSGGSISDAYAQVGPSGSFTEFIEQFDLFQNTGDQVFDNGSLNYIGSFANQTIIYLNVVSVGANLSALTQGSVTVYYKYESL